MDINEFLAIKNSRSRAVAASHMVVETLILNTPTLIPVPNESKPKRYGSWLQGIGRILGKQVQFIVDGDGKLWCAYTGPWIKKERKVKVTN